MSFANFYPFENLSRRGLFRLGNRCATISMNTARVPDPNRTVAAFRPRPHSGSFPTLDRLAERSSLISNAVCKFQNDPVPKAPPVEVIYGAWRWSPSDDPRPARRWLKLR
jgi:hypothetical protein